MEATTLVNYPKTKRGEATLAKIVRAAETEIGKKGYHDASINDITYRARVAPGTFYIYFNDKYSLYCYLLKQYSHAIRKTISMRVADCADYRAKEREGLLAFLELIRKNPYMYNIIWESLHINKELFVEYYEEFSKRYVANLTEGQKEGVVSDVDLTVMSYVLMGISNFIGLKYVFFEDNSDLERIADEVLKILDHGIFGRTENSGAAADNK